MLLPDNREMKWAVAARPLPGEIETGDCHLDGKGSTTEYVTMRGGIVGYRLTELKPSYLRLQDGDIIALATDGILGEFVSTISTVHSPEVLASHILDQCAKPIDDALVLIVRWQISFCVGEE